MHPFVRYALNTEDDGIVNLPEFDLDFSVVYHLQYSSDTLDVEKEFSANMDKGDYRSAVRHCVCSFPVFLSVLCLCLSLSLCARMLRLTRYGVCTYAAYVSLLRVRDAANVWDSRLWVGGYSDQEEFRLFNGASDFQVPRASRGAIACI